jgi:hypothetical protein
VNRYDIIGDVHGQANALHRILGKLGYEQKSESWRHPDGRKAIFLGDFVDIGPGQLDVITTVRRMIDGGDALAVMGNHELNALAWFLPDQQNPGEYLRPHFSEPWGSKNRHQHAAFLAEVEANPSLHSEIIDWFFTLPLWLELPEIRVVHACWSPEHIAYLRSVLGETGLLTPGVMPDVTPPPDEESKPDQVGVTLSLCVETLTKGPEIALPPGASFLDKYGIERKHMRMRWWDPEAVTYRTAGLVDESLRSRLADIAIPPAERIAIVNDKPIFIGHYWLTGPAAPLSDYVACVDYSAGRGDRLCAYRWDGEKRLITDKFCCVSV